MDYSSIEKFVTDMYQNMSGPDLQDLIAEASVFLDEQGLTGVDDAVAPSLSIYLAEYQKQQSGAKVGRDVSRNWRERSFSEMPEPFDTRISDEEKISAIAKDPIFNEGVEVKEEFEESSADFKRKRKKLQSLLPPAVFEALERILLPETPPRWTAGLERTGLFLLYRRARIRMEWKDYE